MRTLEFFIDEQGNIPDHFSSAAKIKVIAPAGKMLLKIIGNHAPKDFIRQHIGLLKTGYITLH